MQPCSENVENDTKKKVTNFFFGMSPLFIVKCIINRNEAFQKIQYGIILYQYHTTRNQSLLIYLCNMKVMKVITSYNVIKSSICFIYASILSCISWWYLFKKVDSRILWSCYTARTCKSDKYVKRWNSKRRKKN